MGVVELVGVNDLLVTRLDFRLTRRAAAVLGVLNQFVSFIVAVVSNLFAGCLV